MSELWNTFLQGLTPVITVVLEVALVLLVGVATQFIKKYCTKLGINIDDSQISSIEDLVYKAVVTVNQKLVDDLKAISPNGKLTEEQQQDVYDMAYTIIKNSLSEDQFGLLAKVYGDAETGIEVLIENMVVQAKNYNTLITGDNSAIITETTSGTAGEMTETESDNSGEIIMN